MSEGIDYIEALIHRRPVTVRRRVLWSECDPAQVVYTGHFFDYLASCYGWFRRVVLEAGVETLGASGLGLPLKAVSLEFHRMLRPDDWFEMVLAVIDVRTRTFDVEVRGRTLEGTPVFAGRLSPIVVDDVSKRSAEIPRWLREVLEEYRAAH